MNIHFIAIGGSAMHNLAIALHKKGCLVTGSDDEIFEPSRSRLAKYGILPSEFGWHPERIHRDIDVVILGMHARADNPELLKSNELNLKICSFPEFLYEHARNKQRIVIGGSHGKTTITAMVMHVLQSYGRNFDYLVGAELEGFDVMVKLSDEAPVIIIEGDEYLTSALDKRPKFHVYQPHVALISGISWDHINAFPTYEDYYNQFVIFVNMIENDGKLIYYENDPKVKKVALHAKSSVEKIPYVLPTYKIKDGKTFIIHKQKAYPLLVFGEHNLANLNGARLICNQLNISDEEFLRAISSYRGASKRLEIINQNKNTAVYLDFAHSPSKLKATILALKNQYPDRKLVACMELHTFSSLNKSYLDQYKGTMDEADIPVVYFNPYTIQLKKLPAIEINDVKKAFGIQSLHVFNDSGRLNNFILSNKWKDKNLLLMSSGNFDGINVEKLANVLMHS